MYMISVRFFLVFLLFLVLHPEKILVFLCTTKRAPLNQNQGKSTVHGKQTNPGCLSTSIQTGGCRSGQKGRRLRALNDIHLQYYLFLPLLLYFSAITVPPVYSAVYSPTTFAANTSNSSSTPPPTKKTGRHVLKK